MAGYCEHGNEPSGSITGGEFLEEVSDQQLLKNGSAPWSLLYGHHGGVCVCAVGMPN
jgi:hypothetical protein